jgi:hypothetical protein
MRTSELQGKALDYAVALSEGRKLHYFVDDPFKKDPWLTYNGLADMPLHVCTPSTNWAQGGPIIEREGIAIWIRYDEGWKALMKAFDEDMSGETPLIAAMRCYVKSKLGDEIEIPEGLK